VAAVRGYSLLFSTLSLSSVVLGAVPNTRLGFPREAVLDVLRIYAVVLPLFLMASLFEFLAV
jgi:hypothetical protein